MRLFISIAFFSILFFSCKNSNPPTPASPAKAVELGPEVPGIPTDVMVQLLNQCTYIDYIFKDLPFSVSQNEDPSIDQNIRFIDSSKPVGHLPQNCTPIARKFFQINGEIVYDVDVYFSNNCTFYVFVDKQNKPIYANYMTPAGIEFYNNIIKQAATAAKSMGQ